MASIQALSDSDRWSAARWALTRAERLLPLSDTDSTAQGAILDALARTRENAMQPMKSVSASLRVQRRMQPRNQPVSRPRGQWLESLRLLMWARMRWARQRT